MSPIESVGRSQAPAPYSPIGDLSFDPAAVLLALSVQQFGIMQTTLANQITGARSQIGKIADTGSTALEVGRLRDNVIAGEAAAVEEALAMTRSVGAKYMGGEPSSLTVSDADNERMKQLGVWAEERGFTLAEMTRLDPPTEEALAAAKEAGADPPQPQMVIDEAAVKINIDALLTYLSDVRLGVADNSAIRQALADSPGAMSLLEKVRRHGYDGDAESLADLEAASRSLQQSALAALATLAASTDAVRRLADQIAETGSDFEALVKDQDAKPQSQDEADRIKAELRRAELQEILQDALLEHAAALTVAEGIGLAAKLPPELATTLLGNLSDIERTHLDKDLAAWKADFAAQASPDSSRPSHNSLAEMRRDYL